MFSPCNTNKRAIVYRKDCEDLPARDCVQTERIFPGVSFRMVQKAALTLEAAVVVPLFLFGMLAVLQFAHIALASSALLAAMEDTAKDVAVYAYIQEMGVTAGEGIGADLLTGGISAGYAKSRILSRSKVTSDMGTVSLLQSSFFRDQSVDLSVSYQPRHTFTILPVIRPHASLRARVRAWTGRTGSAGADKEEGEEQNKEEPTVFVTTTGTVYHKDENCTHIRLSIKSVSKSSLATRRNTSGGKYHACELCGGGSGSSVYIATNGDRYHSSLTCSGLKRTVKSVPVSEVKGWRPCSKCGG